MVDLTNIYKVTKQIDEQFAFHYGNDDEIVRKNRLEILVELGELANETRCFKYWSVRQNGEKEKILDEYIDCLFMTLYFCNITGVSLNEEFPEHSYGDIIETFINLFKYSSKLEKKPTKDDIKLLLVELEYLAELLEFNNNDLEQAAKRKRKIIEDRFNNEY